jgi:hypothetical protein
MSGFTPDLGPWVTYAPGVPVSSVGAFTSATSTGRYKRLGKLVFVKVRISITTNGTAAGFTTIAMPFTSVSIGATDGHIFAGQDTAVGGFMGVGKVANNSTNFSFTKYDGSYLGADGSNILFTGCYEAA